MWIDVWCMVYVATRFTEKSVERTFETSSVEEYIKRSVLAILDVLMVPLAQVRGAASAGSVVLYAR